MTGQARKRSKEAHNGSKKQKAKIAELENLTVTDEDTEAEIKKIADMYGLETDKVKEQVSPDMLAEDIKVGKAVDIVKANAVITDKAPEAAE